jgi:ribulose-bisphosphate carboxylase small chain
MRLTQGTFSFLPDLTDEQITKQIEYCLGKGWALSVEYTDDPHPRNTYWEMWGMPMFDLADAAGILYEVNGCRRAFPNHYIRLNAFDSTRGVESLQLSFIVNRPEEEPGFRLERTDTVGRNVRYTLHSYATDRPEGGRYG